LAGELEESPASTNEAESTASRKHSVNLKAARVLRLVKDFDEEIDSLLVRSGHFAVVILMFEQTRNEQLQLDLDAQKQRCTDLQKLVSDQQQLLTQVTARMASVPAAAGEAAPSSGQTVASVQPQSQQQPQQQQPQQHQQQQQQQAHAHTARGASADTVRDLVQQCETFVQRIAFLEQKLRDTDAYVIWLRLIPSLAVFLRHPVA
jgi:hypothetical protein